MNELVQTLKSLTPEAWAAWTVAVIIGGYVINQMRLDRKLSADDRLARRDGYATQVSKLTDQVKMLMEENRALLADQAALRREYDDHRKICQMETDQLRRMVVDLESEVAALKRNRAVDEIHNIKFPGGPAQ